MHSILVVFFYLRENRTLLHLVAVPRTVRGKRLEYKL